MVSWVRCLDRWLAGLERAAVVVFLTSVLALGLWQVIARNVLARGVFWADELLQHLVLWLGFLGASLATREQRHLRIDLFARLFPAWQPWLAVLVDGTAGIICLLLAHAAWRFLRLEGSTGTSLTFGVPAWVAQGIIPFGFAMMAIRFTLHSLEACLILRQQQTPP
jgi:TRAP-type C4-dicarboxylate transport system permease small subunit